MPTQKMMREWGVGASRSISVRRIDSGQCRPLFPIKCAVQREGNDDGYITIHCYVFKKTQPPEK